VVGVRVVRVGIGRLVRSRARAHARRRRRRSIQRKDGLDGEVELVKVYHIKARARFSALQTNWGTRKDREKREENNSTGRAHKANLVTGLMTCFLVSAPQHANM
jgi:hypothetical protein